MKSVGRRGVFLGYLAALGSAALVGLFMVLNKWLLGEAVRPRLEAAVRPDLRQLAGR